MQSEGLIPFLLEKISDAYLRKDFVPILEADIVGYLYHLLVEINNNAREIHIDTRLCIDPNEKFDVVLGKVLYSGNIRPCIQDPKLIIEIKCFPIGFTQPQHWVHYEHVIKDDIPKLAKRKTPLDNRFILLFDEDVYLKGQLRSLGIAKIEHILQVRDGYDQQLKVIYIERRGRYLKWTIN